MEAIARATGRPLKRNAELTTMLQEFYGAKATPEALSMADLPQGTTLRAPGGWPIFRLDLAAELARKDTPEADQGRRIYILPGVPPLVRSKFEVLAEIEGELPEGLPWVLRELWLQCDESSLAAVLTRVNDEHPSVSIGSYPRWERDSAGKRRIRLRLTFEGSVVQEVEAALQAVRCAAPEGAELPHESEIAH